MGAFDDLAAQFDQVNAKRKGDQFEVICKWFLENDPTYKPRLRRVWLWNDWPGRKGIDAGIDLVAEDQDGKLWAIQAKAYDAAYSISKRDVDKFVAESSRTKFTHRLLIGTTDKRHHLAKTLMDDLGIPFIGLTQLREADDYLDWPATPATLRPSKPPKAKKPHDYQRAAINDVVKGFTTADRGQLIMACGTGKTLTAWFITEKLAVERTLVLVPSLSLLKQTMREWQTANPKKPFATLPVCSDETVGSLGEDAAVGHTSDLGVPVTTDPVEIAEFLRKRSGPRVVFSTYQSSPQIAKAFTLGRVPGFDLVIADEAHRVAGPVSSDFGTVLDAEAIKAKRRLFMTATPRFFTGRVLKEAKEADYEVASMDDHTRFGEVFHRLSFGEAIERKLLTDYQVAIIGVDDATYLDWAQRGTLVTLDGTKSKTDARSLAGQIGLAKAMKKFDLHRVISFHSRVKAAREFSTSMPAVLDWMPPRQRPKGSLWSQYASGEMSAGERGILIQHLKRLDDGERGLLANARCLSEGVDVPALDGVAFIDPRRSEVDIVQAVGRAIRKSDTKTVGTIVIPVFIDTDEDAEVALDSSVFKPVWDVIKALRAHDTELGEQLDALRREMGRKGGKPRLPAKVHVDVPVKVGADFARALETRLVEQTTASWEFWYGLLDKYAAEHGTALVLRDLVVDGHRLGQWTQMQRSAYSTGNLSPERQKRLEKLCGWVWDVLEFRWEEGFRHAEEYVAAFGDARVPNDYRSPDEYRLGQWAGLQRASYLDGKLSPQRTARLEQLPGWVWDALGSQWEQGFRHAEAYFRAFGDARIQGDYVSPDGFRLGQWITVQRSNNSKGKLSSERKTRLGALPGWLWEPQNAQWEDGFRHAVEYGETFGHTIVPALYKSPDGYPLGHWVRVQARNYLAGTMADDRRNRLEALPRWTWKQRENRWDTGFRLLRDFAQQHGSCSVPKDYTVEGFALGTWIKNQRRKQANAKLSAQRMANLESLPKWSWSIHADAWDEGLSHMREYAKDFGNCLVPAAYTSPDGFRLGAWVNAQRGAYAKCKLGDERRQRLESISGWTWNALDAKWEEGFNHAETYAKAVGNAKVPRSYRTPNGFKLGSWITLQRAAYESDTLNPERAARLESLPGWTWNPHSDAWEEGIAHLTQYRNEFNDVLVPQDYICLDGFRLGQWVGNQRTKRKSGRLNADRQEQLESIPGWVWDRRDARWDEAFRHAEAYVKRYGDARIARNYCSPDGFQLGAWAKRQRDYFANGLLSGVRRDKLDSLSGWAWRED